MFRSLLITPLAVAMTLAAANAAEVNLYAAGSRKAALSDGAIAFEQASGQAVDTTFGPSGIMRERIENGEAADVFASANMKHPKKLANDGRGGPVRMFARNKLCAIAQPGLDIDSASLLEVISSAEVRLGTSTPKSDPSGDYAWELFAKADKVEPGSEALLEDKAMKLTGGPNSEKPPEGRNNYGWVMDTDQADVFLTYCTNAVLARKEVPHLQIVQIPPELSVGADYGLMVLKGAPEAAGSLADFILGDQGQAILEGYGFESAADTP